MRLHHGILCPLFVMLALLVINYLHRNTIERQWLEHLWDHENMFETGVVRANEC